MSLLQGDPQTLAFGLADPALQSIDAFFEALALLYDDPDRQASAESDKWNLKQGRDTAKKYCTEFRRWATDSGWNATALCSKFRLGLFKQIKDSLIHYPTPSSLDRLMELAIRVDRRFRERRMEKAGDSASFIPSFSSLQEDKEEPMLVGVLRLSQEEKAHRLHAGLCLYSGEKGHVAYRCPHKPGKARAK